jgi:crotonobetainyl-CoA:carnitine CoA-transferase CaiB-like acyl-CoA transferase
MAGASAVAMALYHRDAKGGTGQMIDLNLLEPIMTAVGPAPTVYDKLGTIQGRTGNRSTNNAPRNLYKTNDGHWVAISTSADVIAERVMRLVGHPEVIDEPWFASGYTRAQHADLLDEYVGGWIAERSRAEVIETFEAAGAAAAPVYSAADIVHDPQVRDREMLLDVNDEELGQLKLHNVLFRMSETPGGISWTGRPLGADTEAVLIDDLGLPAERVAELRERGVVA